MTDARGAAEMVRAWPCPAQCDNGVIAHGPLPDGSWEPQQCQFCDERGRILAILDAMREGPSTDSGWIDAGVWVASRDSGATDDEQMYYIDPSVPEPGRYHVWLKPEENDE